jgi:multiple sugar transport system ATP-binding protein
MVAGLEDVTEGEILIGDQKMTEVDAGKRDIAMVFQNYALYPHMSVFDNIAFPLRGKRIARSEIRERVERTAAILGLSELLRRKPKTLSGGQRQRTAMGRAIVRSPQAFLMDEPLSNLDAKLRVQMRAEIARLQAELGVTTIFVTHDQVEAMTMGTRIAVMRKGVLQQHGAPQELYDRPENLFVATFIGSPGMNLLRATVEQKDDRLVCRVGEARLRLPDRFDSAAGRLSGYRDRDVALGFRPEHLGVVTHGSAVALDCVVTRSETLGSERLLHVQTEAEPVLHDAIIEAAQDVDSTAVAELERESAMGEVPLVSRVDSSFVPEPNSRIKLGVQTERMHVFDLDTGESI